MTKIILLMALCYSTAVEGAERELTSDEWVAVARCRSSCLHKYVEAPASDSECIGKTSCYLCWQVCERVQTSASANLCQPDHETVCVGGCAVACDFLETDPMTSVSEDFSQWDLPNGVSTRVASPDQLVVTWSLPKRHSATDITNNPVFVLFWKYDEQPQWKVLLMTSELWGSVDGPHAEYSGLLFRFLAVLPSGIILERTASVSYETPDGGRQAQPAASNHVTNTRSSQAPRGHQAGRDPLVPGVGNISVSVSDENGVVRANVSWTRGEGIQTDAQYTVQWGRSSCRVQNILPDCDLTDNRFIALVQDDGRQEPLSLILPGLTFNSRYWLRIQVEDREFVEDAIFFTPWCHQLNDSFSHCLYGRGFESDSLPQITKSDLDSAQKAQQVPVYTTLSICLVIAVLFIVFVAIFIRKQSQVRQLVLTRTRSLRSSVRSKASGLRTSVKDRAVRLGKSLRRSPRSQRMTRVTRRDNNVAENETSSPMLAQRIIASKKGVSFLHQPPPIIDEYDVLPEKCVSESSLPTTPIKTSLRPIQKGQRSLPELPQVNEFELSPDYRNLSRYNSSPV